MNSKKEKGTNIPLDLIKLLLDQQAELDHLVNGKDFENTLFIQLVLAEYIAESYRKNIFLNNINGSRKAKIDESYVKQLDFLRSKITKFSKTIDKKRRDKLLAEVGRGLSLVFIS